MGNFFAELKRRHIYRVAAAYAVVAWVLIQLVNNIAPMLNLPTSMGTVVLVLLVVGFPIAILFAWIQKLASNDGAATRPATGKLDWVLIGALVVVIALVSYQQLAPAPGARPGQQQAGPVPAAARGGISIAVLPFVNLSGDAGQEFFSDGMTEEITAALAQVQGLRVLGRTSAFEFKGQNKDLRTIGQALGATHLIEGSVRKAGNRVRITAQLVKADDDSHLWAENYDRDLTDVFVIQEEIAKAIAGALRVPLGLQQGDSLVRDRTKDLESYDQYLRAKGLIRARGQQPITDAIALLEPAVTRDPGFAPAWALLAQAYALVPLNSPPWHSGPVEAGRRFVQSFLDKAEKAAREAIRLDSRNALAYAALARARQYGSKWAEADDIYKQAIALDPDEPEVLANYATTLVDAGRIKEALSIYEKLRMLEPFVPIYTALTAYSMQMNGQNAASIPILEALPPNNAFRTAYLFQAYAGEGRYADAADVALLSTAGSGYSRSMIEDAARLIRGAPAASEPLPALEGGLALVYAYVGAFDRTLEFYSERALATGLNIGVSELWLPVDKPIRKSERFKAYVRKAGLVDYWKARGWPDLCRPVGADDFVCD